LLFFGEAADQRQTGTLNRVFQQPVKGLPPLAVFRTSGLAFVIAVFPFMECLGQ